LPIQQLRKSDKRIRHPSLRLGDDGPLAQDYVPTWIGFPAKSCSMLGFLQNVIELIPISGDLADKDPHRTNRPAPTRCHASGDWR